MPDDLDRSTGKCIRCIPVSMETGCFIFGVISSVLSGIGVITMIIVQTLFDFTVKQQDLDENSTTQIHDMAVTYADMLVLFLIFLSSFFFSVLLCYGIHKKRPGFVKAYQVYGTILNGLIVVGTIIFTWAHNATAVRLIVFIICGIYTMLLMMVRRTHKLIRAQKARENGHPPHNIDPCVKA